MSIFLILFPIFIIVFILRNRYSINEEKHERWMYIKAYKTNKSLKEMDEKFVYNRKFSTIYQGLAIANIWQMLFYAIFLLRRLLLSVVLV